MRQRRGIPRVALVAWLALIVGVAIWTERRLGDRSDATPPAPVATPAPAAPPRPHRPAAPPASLSVAALPRVRLEGHVIDPDGRDVAGAVVTLDPEPGVEGPFGSRGRANSSAAARTSTDAAGRFAFEAIEPRAYLVSAVAATQVADPIRYLAGDAARPLVIRLDASGAATVNVSDEAGAAIAGARVEARAGASRSTAATDAHGQATVGPLRPGSVWITVEAPGLAPGSRSLWLTAPGAHADVAITLYRGLPVSGRVVDEHRQPIAGAQIAASAPGTAARGAPSASDERGEFSFAALARGSYTLVVSADDHVAVHTTVAVDRTAVRGLEIVMTSGASITGVVVDAGQRAVASATVFARYHGGAVQTTSDAGGNFELHGLAAGFVSVGAETPAGQTGSVSVRLDASTGTPDIEIVVDGAGVIAGTVVDDQGAALAGIPVQAYPDYSQPSRRDGKGSGYGHATTDDAGGFVITGLADMSFLVFAGRRDIQPATLPPPESVITRVGDRGVRLTLLRGGRLVGRVVDQSGIAVDDARVAVFGASAATDRDGAFDLRDIRPGRHDLNSLIRGVRTLARKDIVVRAGETTDLGTLTVARPPPGRSLTGRVVDPAGAPVGNARVELGVIRPPPVEEDDPPGGFHAYRTSYTTPDGSFRIPDIFPTPMLARATDFAYGPSATIAIPAAAVSPGDPLPITLVLSPRDR